MTTKKGMHSQCQMKWHRILRICLPVCDKAGFSPRPDMKTEDHNQTRISPPPFRHPPKLQTYYFVRLWQYPNLMSSCKRRKTYRILPRGFMISAREQQHDTNCRSCESPGVKLKVFYKYSWDSVVPYLQLAVALFCSELLRSTELLNSRFRLSSRFRFSRRLRAARFWEDESINRYWNRLSLAYQWISE